MLEYLDCQFVQVVSCQAVSAYWAFVCCSMNLSELSLFSADHYLSVRGALIEMTHDELDLFVMEQIMANCFVSSSALSLTENRYTM